MGLPSEVDIFLNLRGETVTSIITEKTATAKKTLAASDYPGRKKRLTECQAFRMSIKSKKNQTLYWPNTTHSIRYERKYETNSNV